MAHNANEQRGSSAITILDEIEDSIQRDQYGVTAVEVTENTGRSVNGNTSNNNGNSNNNNNNGNNGNGRNNNNNGSNSGNTTTNPGTRRQNRIATPAVNERTVIGSTATIRGDIALEGDAQILGCVEGRLQVGGSLEVGPDAVINAQVLCGEMTIEGRVEGDVLAERAITLGDKATLIGDLFANQLTVPEGATCKGMVTIGPDAADEARPSFARKNGKTNGGLELKDA